MHILTIPEQICHSLCLLSKIGVKTGKLRLKLIKILVLSHFEMNIFLRFILNVFVLIFCFQFCSFSIFLDFSHFEINQRKKKKNMTSKGYSRANENDMNKKL